MELLIIRHAIAHARDRKQWPDDADRPLTAIGKRGSRKAALGLKDLCRAPDRLLSSPLVRAEQTAHLLTKIAGWPRAVLVPELKPGESVAALLSLLRKDRSRCIALVGHEPDLSSLLAACVNGNPGAFAVEMKKNAVACLSFSGRARAGGATLKWLATPRLLRGFSDR